MLRSMCTVDKFHYILPVNVAGSALYVIRSTWKNDERAHTYSLLISRTYSVCILEVTDDLIEVGTSGDIFSDAARQATDNRQRTRTWFPIYESNSA